MKIPDEHLPAIQHVGDMIFHVAHHTNLPVDCFVKYLCYYMTSGLYRK